MQKTMSLARHCFLLITLFAPRLQAQPVSAEDFLERAREHFERRRFLNALESLRVTLQMTEEKDAREYRPKLEAEILSAECLAALGRHEEAANMYERALSHGYTEKKVLAYLAQHFDGRKLYDRAAPYFEQYYAADKADSATHIRFAKMLGRQKKRDRAKQVLESLEPQPAKEKPEDCERLERRHKLREAYSCVTALRNARPDKEQHYLSRYRLAMAQKQQQLVIECAEDLYFLFGSDSRYVWPLIEARIATRKFYDARILLEEVIAINGNDSEAKRLLANLKNDAPRAVEKPFRATPKEMQFLETGK